MIRALISLMLLSAPSLASAQSSEQRVIWNRPAEPFRLIGNVYYVGTAGLSAFLVTGLKGHVLIDGGLPESAPLIAANIRKLGFRPGDVRIILLNHAHYDHAGGLAALKRLTGARLVASAGDAGDLAAGRTRYRPDLAGFPAVRVDRIIRDGEIVRVGPIALTAHLTPGHTKGATSWTTVADGRRVIFASSISVADQPLIGDRGYPTAAADFRSSFAKLATMRADVFVNFHTEGFDMAAKRAAQLSGKRDAFVDPSELQRRVAEARAAFDEAIVEQRAAKATAR